MSSVVVRRLTRGRPRQLAVMKLNMLGSIRFDFEVPGGQCPRDLTTVLRLIPAVVVDA